MRLALTLLDVLDYMEKIPMVTGYKLTDGTITKRFPMGMALDTGTARGGVSARLALRYHCRPQVGGSAPGSPRLR